MNYLTYLSSQDFDVDRMRSRPEFYFKFKIGLTHELFVKKIDDKYTLYMTGFIPSVCPVALSHQLGERPIYVYGNYPTLELCLMQFFEFVQEFLESKYHEEIHLYCVNLSCDFSMFRNKWTVTYTATDFPYMRLSQDINPRAISTKRLIYSGSDYITAFCHYKPLLKEFISYVL